MIRKRRPPWRSSWPKKDGGAGPNQVSSATQSQEQNTMENTVSVMILAAGLGTRMKSKKAKVLHEAGGLPLIAHVVRTCLAVAKAENIVTVVGHQAEKVQDCVRDSGVRFAVQTEQLGTGHAAMSARSALGTKDGMVVVLYGDGPLLKEETLRSLVNQQANSDAAATLITTELGDPTGYGRVITGDDGNIEAIVEQKAATPEQLRIREINSGIYCFRADLLWKHLDEITTDNPAGEYYLTDMVEIFRNAGYGVQTMPVEDSSELLGINSRVELAEVDRIFRARKARELMLAGVTIEKPESVSVDVGAKVGRDTIIGPFARILGDTEIGEDCYVGAHSLVRDSRLADGVRVNEYSIVNDSVAEANCTIGPYARLRIGNHIEAGAAVGNFVELKKARLGAGAKALHLTYLGDSVIGPGVNIGAGTITCNYDGVKKYQTKIGSGAFVGSNSTLIAPLEVGEGSYIAAGSVITSTVPVDALGVGRGRQVNKEGWARRRREHQKKGS
jgi:bifunctional UDP-N-acetylglucosamine pyrophosphorylase / glucosamine-1-phosphate N-acetyltransferase